MFYDRVLSLCKERGVALTRLVESLGLSKGNLFKWRSGAVPKADTLKALADYFGITMEALLEDSSPGPCAPAAPASSGDGACVLLTVCQALDAAGSPVPIALEPAVGAPPGAFYFCVNDNSFAPAVLPGDLALIAPGPVPSGALALIRVGDAPPTLCRFMAAQGTLFLLSPRPDSAPILVPQGDPGSLSVLGRVLSTQRRTSW